MTTKNEDHFKDFSLLSDEEKKMVVLLTEKSDSLQKLAEVSKNMRQKEWRKEYEEQDKHEKGSSRPR